MGEQVRPKPICNALEELAYTVEVLYLRLLTQYLEVVSALTDFARMKIVGQTILKVRASSDVMHEKDCAPGRLYNRDFTADLLSKITFDDLMPHPHKNPAGSNPEKFFGRPCQRGAILYHFRTNTNRSFSMQAVMERKTATRHTHKGFAGPRRARTLDLKR